MTGNFVKNFSFLFRGETFNDEDKNRQGISFLLIIHKAVIQ